MHLTADSEAADSTRVFEYPYLVDRIAEVDRIPAKPSVASFEAIRSGTDPPMVLGGETNAELANFGIINKRELCPRASTINALDNKTL